MDVVQNIIMALKDCFPYIAIFGIVCVMKPKKVVLEIKDWLAFSSER